MDVNYFWNIFLNYLKESIWINEENIKMNVIKKFIDELNIENLIGKIYLDKTILEQIPSSQEKSSSKSNDLFFEFINYEKPFEYTENIQDINNKDSINEPNTNLNTKDLDYQKNIIDSYVEDLKNKFKNIKDNINSDKTLPLRREVFIKFMDFFQIKYHF
jgi:hypothetical protein